MAPRPSPLARVPTEPLEHGTLNWAPRKQQTELAVRTCMLPSVREPSDTDPEADSATHSLKQYLQESWFPAFQVGPRAKREFIWPHYPELQAPHRTRKLRAISRITHYRIHGAASDYLARQTDKQIIRPLSGGSSDLTLPSINLVKCHDKDIRFYMQDVNFVTDITKILLVSVFQTVARCLYMLLDIPEGEEGDYFRSLVQFKTSFEMCPVKDKIFDVVSLGSPHAGRASMIILVIPPWALDNIDFLSFVNTGSVTPGSLDAFPADKLASAPDIIWAILWDMCAKHRCSYFAVTTYEFWAFGNFTSNMENAYISDLFRAPIHSHDAQVQRDMLSSPTMAETLLFWMAACMGIGGINWVPFDDKATS